MKNLLKRFETWLNKKKGLFAGIITLSGVLGIAVSYIGVITPLQVRAYDLAQEGVKTSLMSVYDATEPTTIREHVWQILTKEGGLTFDEAMVGMEIVFLESRWDEYAIGDNGKSHGLWQIHEPSHPDISRACKFDVYCSTREALKIYKSWGGWEAWSTFDLIKP